MGHYYSTLKSIALSIDHMVPGHGASLLEVGECRPRRGRGRAAAATSRSSSAPWRRRARRRVDGDGDVDVDLVGGVDDGLGIRIGRSR